jgi:hypothetical protein
VGKQGKPHIHNMSMSVFGYTILLMCVRARDVMGDVNGAKKSSLGGIWLKRSRAKWFHKKEYSFQMLNHLAQKIPLNPSSPFLSQSATLLCSSPHTQVVLI